MKLINEIRTQLSLVIFLVSINFLAYMGIIPTADALTSIIYDLFEKHGLSLVSLFSFLENLAGFNAYFPGSIVILTSMALTAGDPIKAVITFLFIVIPSIVAHNVNYFFGRIVKNKMKINKVKFNNSHSSCLSNWVIFFSTLWHPHFAAITCIAAGSEGLSFRNFLKYFLPISIFWNVFWGIAMYYLGDLASATSNLMPFFYAYIVIWALWDIKKYYQTNIEANIC